MRRLLNRRRSKRALTLVELVVAMALTVIFAGACIMLIYPISRIYTHMNEQARVQLVADNVVDALRAECARTYIKGPNDVWIAAEESTAYTIPELPVSAGSGPVLVIRRNYDHCETIASCYSLNDETFNAYNVVYAAELATLAEGEEPQTGANGGTASRAIYRMFDPAGDPQHRDANAGYVHFGYYELDPNASGYVMPIKYYDFTNPLPFASYGERGAYSVELRFHDLTNTTEANGNVPAYVLCDVTVLINSQPVYTRSNVVLCFASPSV